MFGHTLPGRIVFRGFDHFSADLYSGLTELLDHDGILARGMPKIISEKFAVYLCCTFSVGKYLKCRAGGEKRVSVGNRSLLTPSAFGLNRIGNN